MGGASRLMVPDVYGTITVVDLDGHLLQIVSPDGIRYLVTVCWNNTQPKLVALDTSSSESDIHFYSVTIK